VLGGQKFGGEEAGAEGKKREYSFLKRLDDSHRGNESGWQFANEEEEPILQGGGGKQNLNNFVRARTESPGKEIPTNIATRETVRKQKTATRAKSLERLVNKERAYKVCFETAEKKTSEEPNVKDLRGRFIRVGNNSRGHWKKRKAGLPESGRNGSTE